MGLGYSTTKPTTTDRVDNVKNLFNINNLELNDDDRKILDSLNITEFGVNTNKPTLPVLGGNLSKKDEDEDEDLENNLNDLYTDFNLVGGNNNDIRFMSKRRRYLKHNIFKILNQLNNSENNQKGGNGEEEYLSTSSDDSAIKNIKDIILKEVNKIAKSSGQLGAGCGCDKNKQQGGAKSKSKAKSSKSAKSAKSAKSKSKQKGGESDSTENQKSEEDSSSSSSSSESGSSSSSSSSETETETEKLNESSYNEGSVDPENSQSEEDLDETEDDESEETTDSKDKSETVTSEKSSTQKGGLSIFPFNSSEIKTSASEKRNMRMIRRKI